VAIAVEPNDHDAPHSYAVTTNGTVSTGTTSGTVTSILYLWRPASVPGAARVHHLEIHGSAGAAGSYLIRIARITAENGTPGGTLQPHAKFDPESPTSPMVGRSGAAAPTRSAADYFTDSMSGSVESDVHLENHWGMLPVVLVPGSGLEVRTEITSTLSQAAALAVSIGWTEGIG